MRNQTKHFLRLTLFWVILFLLLYVGYKIATAQDVVITNFEGMNTNSSVKTYCTNFDIVPNNKLGKADDLYLTKRKAYLQLLPIISASVRDTLNGDDPNTGIFSFRRADGVKRIVGIVSQAGDTASGSADSTGLGWFLASPGLPATVVGSGAYYYLQEQASRRYYNYVYQGVTPHWTYWNDNCYVTFDGRQRPLVFHAYNEMGRDGYVRELVPLTPGEPLIVPRDVTGNLNGEYFYLINHNSPCGSATGADSITDGPFTNWTGNKPDSWDTLLHGTSTIIEEGTVVMDGSAVRFTNQRLFKAKDSVAVTQEVQVQDDSTYIASVWINVRNSDGTTTRMAIRDTSGTSIENISQYGPTDGWIKLETQFTPTSGQNAIDFTVSFVGDYEIPIDTCYVDSALVQRVDPLGQRLGVVTKPVLAFNEDVLLTNFGWQTIAAGCAFNDTDYDTLDLEIYRTKANPGDIDKNDKFWWIKTINIAAADSFSVFDTLTYIDTLADSAIGHGSYVEFLIIDTSKVGRDSNLVLSGVRVGAPTYVDTAEFDGSMFLNPIADSAEISKTSYICTYYDTLINAESDSSRSLHIYRNFTIDTSGYKIGLPPLPGGKRHLTRKLYKSYDYIIDIPKDSVLGITQTTVRFYYGYLGAYDWDWKTENVYEPQAFITNIVDNGWDIYINPPWQSHRDKDNWNSWITYFIKYYEVDSLSQATLPETTKTAYKLIAEIKNSDSVFIDTIGFDSTQKGKHYFKSEAPFNLSYVTSFEDRLWGAVGSRLYWSYLDTGSVWGSYRYIVLDADDGDAITAIIPMRDYVRVFKNMSQYLVFPGETFEYQRREMIEDLGCIAPHTARAYQNGVFYLSHQGLIREQGSEYRDRGSKFGIISRPINNILLNRTRDALRKAYGIVHKEKYWLSFADVDTTFVYNLVSGGWSIYDYAFTQTTFYDTAAVNSKSITPSGDMVFINGETDQLYKADTVQTDKGKVGDISNDSTRGTAITTEYRSAPFGVSPDWVGVSQVGMWKESNDASAGIDVKLINAEGDTVWTDSILTVAERYSKWQVDPSKSNYFQFNVSDTLDSLAIDKIDIWLFSKGKKIVK